MIRLTWRQLRTQAAVAVGALAAIAVILAITGPHLVHLYATVVATCKARGDCDGATTAFLKNDHFLQQAMGPLVLFVPALLGIFWAAPLIARELETGTYRLAWTQSVTRTRWLAAKLGVVGLSSMVVTGLLSFMVTWWSSPIDKVEMNRFTPGVFDERGIAVIGYAAFAFALGATAGALIRRTLPAMATTLVAFIGARLAFVEWIRPHLMAPLHRALALDPAITGSGSSNGGPTTLFPEPPYIPNAWIYSPQIVDKAGHPLTPQFVATACPHLGVGRPGIAGPRVQVPDNLRQQVEHCVTKVGATFHELVSFQPANRYWAFQWYEMAIFVGLALGLAGLCFWWVRRRIS
jgi:ABC-2 family transporter protein